MAVAAKCLACDRYRDACNGRDTVCERWKPIDFDTASPGLPPKSTAVILPTIPPTIVRGGDLVPEHEHAKPPIPVGETRQQKFARIGNKRQQQALEAIRKLEHLTSRYRRTRTDVTAYTYEWTMKQAQDLVRPIEEALETLKSELISPDTPREYGLVEASSGVPMNEIGENS